MNDFFEEKIQKFESFKCVIVHLFCSKCFLLTFLKSENWDPNAVFGGIFFFLQSFIFYHLFEKNAKLLSY